MDFARAAPDQAEGEGSAEGDLEDEEVPADWGRETAAVFLDDPDPADAVGEEADHLHRPRRQARGAEVGADRLSDRHRGWGPAGRADVHRVEEADGSRARDGVDPLESARVGQPRCRKVEPEAVHGLWWGSEARRQAVAGSRPPAEERKLLSQPRRRASGRLLGLAGSPAGLEGGSLGPRSASSATGEEGSDHDRSRDRCHRERRSHAQRFGHRGSQAAASQRMPQGENQMPRTVCGFTVLPFLTYGVSVWPRKLLTLLALPVPLMPHVLEMILPRLWLKTS